MALSSLHAVSSISHIPGTSGPGGHHFPHMPKTAGRIRTVNNMKTNSKGIRARSSEPDLDVKPICLKYPTVRDPII